MPDPIQQTPSSDLLARAREYRNIQEEVGELFAKQNKSIHEIIGLERSLDKGLMARIKRQRELTDTIKKSKESLLIAEKATALAVGGVDKKNAKNIEDSIRKELAGLNAEFDLISKINKQAMIPWIYFLSQAWNLFQSMDKAAESFRMKMGAVRDNVKNIRVMAEKLAVNFMHVGVTIDGVYNSVLALGKEMGSVHLASESLVKTTALLKAQLGVAEEDSAGFFRNMAAVSKSTMQAQENMAYIAQDMAAAAGVPLPDIMRDIAKMSGVTLTMVSRVPNQILRASIEARRMNTSLGEMAKSGREILNFSDNINAEMEASVLLGRSINLQRARQLAYNRDLVGSTKEILRITRNINFENLDVFQQEAFARATGKSVEELLKMVQAEKQWDAARRSSDPKIKAQIEAYDKLLKMNETQSKDRAKDIGLMVQQQANQQRLTAITNKWNEVVAQAASVFLPVIDALLSIVPMAIDVGRSFFGIYAITVSIAKAFQGVGLALATWTEGFSKVSGFFLKIAGIGETLLGWVGKFLSPLLKVGGIIGSWIGPLAKFISPFLKILGPIGWIITAFQGIYGAISGWNSVTGSFADKLKGAVMGALRAIIPGFDWIVEKVKWLWGYVGPIATFLWKWTTPIGLIVQAFKYLKDIVPQIGTALVETFNKAWTGIKKWLGFSPSELGLSILKGIVSVGAMMYDALTAPFRKGMAWIADKIPGMGKVAEKLRGGVSGLLNKPVEAKIAAAYVPAVTVTPTGTTVAGATTNKTGETATDKKESNNSDKLLQDILMAINTLNANLEAGKIGINMDGQLLSATLARQTEFRGGYGVNKV